MLVAINGQPQMLFDQFETAFREAFEREMTAVGEIVADYGQRVHQLEKELAQLRDLLGLETDAAVAETDAAVAETDAAVAETDAAGARSMGMKRGARSLRSTSRP